MLMKKGNQELMLKYANNTEENQRVIPGIDDSRQVIRWAHQNKKKLGEVSEIFRCGDKFLVAVVTRVEEEGVANIEDVKDAVDLAKALCGGGLPIAEVTFRTKAAKGAIEKISKDVPEMIVGAGTILSIDQARK